MFRSFLLAALVFHLCTRVCFSLEVSAYHSGTNNPIVEGFSISTGSNVSVSSIDDAGTPAWNISTTNVGGGVAIYTYNNFNDTHYRLLFFNDWKASFKLRIPIPLAAFNSGVEIDLVAGRPDRTVRNFGMNLGTDGATNVQVNFSDGSGSYTSAPGFHLYELYYSNATQRATLYVDGIKAVTNITGTQVGGGPFLRFGSFGSKGVGYWNLVKFEVDATPVLTDVLRNENNASLEWVGASGRTFSVQSTTNVLDTLSWFPVPAQTNIPWSDVMYRDIDDGGTGRFYRILQFSP